MSFPKLAHDPGFKAARARSRDARTAVITAAAAYASGHPISPADMQRVLDSYQRERDAAAVEIDRYHRERLAAKGRLSPLRSRGPAAAASAETRETATAPAATGDVSSSRSSESAPSAAPASPQPRDRRLLSESLPESLPERLLPGGRTRRLP